MNIEVKLGIESHSVICKHSFNTNKTLNYFIIILLSVINRKLPEK